MSLRPMDGRVIAPSRGPAFRSPPQSGHDRPDLRHSRDRHFRDRGATDGLIPSLQDGASEALYAAGADRFFILSTDLIVQIDPGTIPITGRIVTGPFDIAFRKQD